MNLDIKKLTSFLRLLPKREEDVPSEALDAALAAVAQMQEDGYTLVPSEATEEMLAAAAKVSGLEREQLREIWRAMLAEW